MPPLKKRRRPRPHGGHTPRRNAVVRLQRATRRHLARRNAVDPITGEPLVGPILTLVEDPSGAAYRFQVAPLLEYFLKKAQFNHPVTRRPLHPIELWRLSRHAPADVAHVLLLTYKMAATLRRHQAMRENTVVFLEAEAGYAFEELLDAAEASHPRDLEPLLDAYHEAVWELGRGNSAVAHQALRLHRQRERLRADKVVLHPGLRAEIHRVLDELEERHPATTGDGTSPWALTLWLDDSSRGLAPPLRRR